LDLDLGSAAVDGDLHEGASWQITMSSSLMLTRRQNWALGCKEGLQTHPQDLQFTWPSRRHPARWLDERRPYTKSQPKSRRSAVAATARQSPSPPGLPCSALPAPNPNAAFRRWRDSPPPRPVTSPTQGVSDYPRYLPTAPRAARSSAIYSPEPRLQRAGWSPWMPGSPDATTYPSDDAGLLSDAVSGRPRRVYDNRGCCWLMRDFPGYGMRLHGTVSAMRGCRRAWIPVLRRMRVSDGGLPVLRSATDPRQALLCFLRSTTDCGRACRDNREDRGPGGGAAGVLGAVLRRGGVHAVVGGAGS
jgi:hypothetical protein